MSAHAQLEWLPWLDGFLVHYWVKEVTSECESMHCVIHREMLSSCKMSPELNNILQDVLKITNHIKVHALNSYLFTQLSEEMDAEHTCLLLHTKVRWFSKGGSLTRAGLSNSFSPGHINLVVAFKEQNVISTL